MPSEDEPAFACRCLNVKLFERKEGGGGQPPPGASQDLKPLYTGSDGIRIVHNELTLRTRSPVSVDPQGSHTQFTTILCLVCETSTYCVKNSISADSDLNEGPVLPSDDWTERDTLVSKSGWVFVNIGAAGCIGSKEIKRKTASSSLSPQYSVILPNDANAPQQLPLQSSRASIPPEHDFLPGLGPFLPPPPFTSTHPVFLHLSSIATEHSKAARAMSAKCIEDYTKQQMSKLEGTEDRLRLELERLWVVLRQNLKKAEAERDGPQASNDLRRRSSSSTSPGAYALSPSLGGVGSPRITSFVAAPESSNRHFSPPTQQSALATSLRTSAFHHPRAQSLSKSRQLATPSPPPYTSNPSSSAGSPGSANGAVDIVRPRRNMDMTTDTAVTYQYFAIEEQEAERRRRKEATTKGISTSQQPGPAGKTEPEPSKTEVKEGKIQRSSTQQRSKATAEHAKESSEEDGKKREGKRKVTFNVEPNVVTIKREVKGEEAEVLPERADDLLFSYDDETSLTVGQMDEEIVSSAKEEPEIVLPLREPEGRQVKRETTSSTNRKDVNEGLPQSFAALRPSSLPAPSHVRPSLRSREGRNGKAPSTSNVKSRDVPSRPKAKPEVALSPQQQEIRRLVGADMPSHRGSWRVGSDSWKIFEGDNSDQTEESDNDAESTVTHARGDRDISTQMQGLPGSLPIPIASVIPQKISTTASLQPKTSLTDRPGALVPPLTAIYEEETSDVDAPTRKSAAVKRREVYAERNRMREMDPGMLDFAEDTDETNPEEGDGQDEVSASRSRQHALNIIKARNSVPAEGFWRSLA